jgi:hypothetical protein
MTMPEMEEEFARAAADGLRLVCQEQGRLRPRVFAVLTFDAWLDLVTRALAKREPPTPSKN